MSALAQALERAGVKTQEERLREVALKEMVAHADDTNSTINAIWNVVRKDLPMMVSLFEGERRRVIGALIWRTRCDIATAQRKGELKRPIERRAAMVVNLLAEDDARREREVKQQEAEEQARADAEFRERIAAWRKTPIGDVEIGGVPVWDVTPGTARVWVDSQSQKSRTISLLIHGLPEDGRPIGFYRRPEDVAELWRRAAQP